MEPENTAELLENLEEWSEVLKGEVELTHTLASFEKAPNLEEDAACGRLKSCGDRACSCGSNDPTVASFEEMSP